MATEYSAEAILQNKGRKMARANVKDISLINEYHPVLCNQHSILCTPWYGCAKYTNCCHPLSPTF